MTKVACPIAGVLRLPRQAGLTDESVVDLKPAPAVSDDRETAEMRAAIDRARLGDEAAFAQLIRAHERAVFRTALAALGRREDAEDAAQEAFLQAWRHLPSFRGVSSFRTWLLTIAWRKALDRRRSRQAWWKRSTAAAGDPIDEGAGELPSPERAAIARDACDRTRRAIARLSPTLRDTLLLAASGEHTYEEIGIVLGIPVGTVKWRVVEARRLVRSRAAQELERGSSDPSSS
jgi:RNA polymerase sigma-70 factor (ECF subfamily)